MSAPLAEPFGKLLLDLWDDLQQPEVGWQIAVLAGCFLLAWLFDRWVHARFAHSGAIENVARRFGQRGLKRIGLPAAMLLLVLAARPLLAHWHHVNLLNLAVPLLLSLLIIRAVMFVLRHTFSAAAPWLAGFERSFALLVWTVVALHILGLLPQLVALLEDVGFTLGSTRLNLWLILQGAGAVLTTLLVALWAGGLIEARLMGAQSLDGNLRLVLARLARALLAVLAVLIALPMVGIDLTALSVFGGALGVGLGFGLQKIAANYVSGFIILLDRSIKIDNLIEVDGRRGVVSRITTRYTVLRGMTGIETIVPNEMLVSSVINNETFSDPKVRISTQVQVAYDSDLEKALMILVEAAQAQPRVITDPPPKAFVVRFADSGIDLELGFWIADPAEGTLQIKSDIHRAIWQAFKEAGIEIPFPQREVRLLQ
ncbi:mechanosensitive ion channel family protein [Sulfuricystis multivorans]|uniref:mechanosensitive ion channel family protein n=1 Tax=Sulfuricystis multivorans TaxID=2211108 RepID=UPI000F8371D3|nr:mechanosensitive ion channel domain-containing protein [Sulfuricystis multivorans]